MKTLFRVSHTFQRYQANATIPKQVCVAKPPLIEKVFVVADNAEEAWEKVKADLEKRCAVKTVPCLYAIKTISPVHLI